MTNTAIIQDLIELLKAPTSFHATDQIKESLIKYGFKELNETSPWNITKGRHFFVIRSGSICAFILPKKKPNKCTILATHTDSPALKLKPNCEFTVNNMIMLGTEVYGAPLLSSWLNRDLGIAGQISVLNKKKEIETRLVNITDAPCTIPQLAIHLDREVNEKGLLLNTQEHLSAFAGMRSDCKEGTYLQTILKDVLKGDKLLSHDLYLYPLEEPSYIGLKSKFIASYRLDNLASAHASLNSIRESKSRDHTIQIAIFWDFEEIGSRTWTGADSPFLIDTIGRIASISDLSQEEFYMLKASSLCTSIDLSHALHPNYVERHEKRHHLLFEGGIAIKSNAQGRYATDSTSSSFIAKLCEESKLPYQKFVNKTDIPCGSTVGPVNAACTGIRTVDIGLPLLSMHSARELMSTEDHLHLCKLLEKILNS